MPLESKSRLQTLLDLGLTEYQAKAYLALVETGSATAGQLPAESGVPRTRIYATMEQLNEKGLVKILPETPIRYRPVPVQEFLRRRAEEMRSRAGEMEALQETYGREFAIRDRGAPEPGGSFEVCKGRAGVREKLLLMWGGARRSIEFVGSGHSPARLLGKLYSVARERKEDGVRVRFIFPIGTPHMERVQSAFSEFEVRFALEVPPVDACTVDGREGILIHHIPDDPDPYKGEDTAIWWDDPAILKSRVVLFENSWEDSAGLERPTLALVPAALRGWLEQPGVRPKPLLEEMARGLGAQMAASIRGNTVPAILRELNSVFTEAEVAHVGKGKGDRVYVRCRYHEITGRCPEYDTFCRTLLKTVLEEKLGPGAVEEVTHTRPEGCSVTLK
ncbi:MAG: TrmB family transcriptional regulator [Euryarchaeota archaeon]|nr:TrmB family transcriptional regulator [Euryarchaeota archaeon]